MMGVDGSIVRRFAPIAERAARTKTKVCGNRLQFFCVRPTCAYQTVLLKRASGCPCGQLSSALVTTELPSLEIRIRMNGALSVKRRHYCRRHLEGARYSGNRHTKEHEKTMLRILVMIALLTNRR
jgi:hypothetical protein